MNIPDEIKIGGSSITKRPETLKGKTTELKTECGKLFLTLNEWDGELAETFIILGKSGSCVTTLLKIIGTLCSLLLQSGLEKKAIRKIFKKHISGSSCGTKSYKDGEEYLSCPDYMAKMILEELK